MKKNQKVLAVSFTAFMIVSMSSLDPARAQVAAAHSKPSALISIANEVDLFRIEVQIMIVQAAIKTVVQMHVEAAGTLVFLGMNGTISNPTIDDARLLISKKIVTLEAQHTLALHKWHVLRRQLEDGPREDAGDKRMYMAKAKVVEIEAQIADARRDIGFINQEKVLFDSKTDLPELNNLPGDRLTEFKRDVIDRKLQLLKQTAAYLEKEKKFLLGEDPRQ